MIIEMPVWLGPWVWSPDKPDEWQDVEPSIVDRDVKEAGA